MPHFVIFGVIAFFCCLQWLVDTNVEHNTLKYIFLSFLHSIQIIVVYSALYTEKERAINVYERSQRSDGYKNWHDMRHCPETIVSVALFFIINKILLYTSKNWTLACLEGVLLIIPLYFAFPIQQLSRIKYITSSKKYKYFLLYFGYCLFCGLFLKKTNLRTVMIFAVPVIKNKFSNILAVGIFTDSLVCYLLDFDSFCHYLCSISLVSSLCMMSRNYISYRSNMINKNILLLSFCSLIFIIFNLESCLNFVDFRNNLKSNITLISIQLFIISFIIKLIQTYIIANKDKNYLESKFLYCFHKYFDLSLDNDTLAYRNLKDSSKTIHLILITLLSLIYPTDFICLIVVLYLVFREQISLSIPLGLKLFSMLVPHFTRLQLVKNNLFLYHVSLYLMSIGRHLPANQNQFLNINKMIHKIRYETEYPFERTYSQIIIQKTQNYSQIVASLSLFLLVLLIESPKNRERLKILKILRLIYIIVFPISLLTIQFSNSMLLHFHIYSGIKFMNLYNS